MFTNSGDLGGKYFYEIRSSVPSSLLFPITAITDCQSLIIYYQPPADFSVVDQKNKKKKT